MKKLKIRSLTTKEMIEVDRLMIEEYGISLIQMMENAGRNLAELSYRYLQKEKVVNPKVLVLCGAGNNGGGGMVAARHLHNRGFVVTVELLGGEEKLKAVARHQWQIVKKLGLVASGSISVANFDVVVDAMIGYGLDGDPRPPVADWIEQSNASGKDIIALDAPSGLNTTSGKPGNPCIRAQATLTLALPKVGLLSEEAKAMVGDLFVADISVPIELYREMGIDVPKMFERDSIVAVD